MDVHAVFATVIPVFMLTIFLGGNNKLWVDGRWEAGLVAGIYLSSLFVAEVISLIGVTVELPRWTTFVSLAGCLIGLVGVSLMSLVTRSRRAQRWVARMNAASAERMARQPPAADHDLDRKDS